MENERYCLYDKGLRHCERKLCFACVHNNVARN